MTTLAIDYPQRQIPAKLIFALVLATIAVALSAHAVEKHGDEAERVRQCLNDKGEIQVWFRPGTDRYIRVCEVEPGMFGIQIVRKDGWIWKEITSFIKNKFHRLDLIERYLSNQGAVKIWTQ
jgi:hypothetical protein